MVQIVNAALAVTDHGKATAHVMRLVIMQPVNTTVAIVLALLPLLLQQQRNAHVMLPRLEMVFATLSVLEQSATTTVVIVVSAQTNVLLT
jgi:hypothetical protein